ncbi:hypothetical protein GOP47_0017116, partial [Adiantum capillus-veneris]
GFAMVYFSYYFGNYWYYFCFAGSILLLAAGSAETPACGCPTDIGVVPIKCSRGLQRRDESARGDLCRAEVQDMADGVSGKYTIKIPKNVYERQLYYQSKIGNYTHMKGPFDKIVSFIVPLAIGTTAAAMMGRGLWNLSNGTGKKE